MAACGGSRAITVQDVVTGKQSGQATCLAAISASNIQRINSEMEGVIAECDVCKYRDLYPKVFIHVQSGCCLVANPPKKIKSAAGIEVASQPPEPSATSMEEADDPSEPSSPADEGATPYIWPKSATKLLIDEYIAHKAMFNSPSLTKRTVWIRIASALHKKKIMVTSVQAENKWKHLTSRYKIVRDKNHKSGAGTTTCPFYKEIDDILKKSPNIAPISTASNLEGMQNNSGNVKAGSSSTSAVGRQRSQAEPEWMKAWQDGVAARHTEKLAVLEKIASEEKKFNTELLDIIRKGAATDTGGASGSA